MNGDDMQDGGEDGFAIGIDLGGTKVAVAAVNRDDEVVSSHKRATDIGAAILARMTFGTESKTQNQADP